MLKVAKDIIEMDEGSKYGFKRLSICLGGCAMNTTRAANYYFLAQPFGEIQRKVMTVGSIGDDKAGSII